MDEEVNPNLMTGIVVAGIGMVLFMLFSAFWQLSVLVAVVAVGYGGYHLVRTGRIPKPTKAMLRRPTLSMPRVPKLPRPTFPKLPGRSKASSGGRRRRSKQSVG